MTHRNPAVLAILSVSLTLAAQDRLKTMRRYDAARRFGARKRRSIAGGVTITWISERLRIRPERKTLPV
jgi:hypothetical protein